MSDTHRLTKAQWQQIKEWFNDLADVDLSAAARRLQQLTDDEAMQQAVLQMIQVHQQAADQTITPRQSAAAVIQQQSQLQPGQSFSRYQIIKSLGTGGMGQVYLAERNDEVQQLVAIKVLAEHSLDAQTQARFDTERRALAALEHPNIARLIDAGTADHRPYYVMEYIDGQPIDVHCQQQGLDLAARLQLFLQVCEAVSHAHNNLIVHRDLKPSNIMVTQDGVVKLLDFGIAKPLKILPGTETLHETMAGSTAMTPQYAAPEQVQGQAITVACDIYVLGLVLYNLLTDHHAFDLTGHTWGRIERIISEQLPNLPSHCLKQQASSAPTWQHKLKGDLDAIVAHALKKGPAERYPSVRAMAEDVGRYLRHEPLSIKRNQTAYRLKKQLRRHWLPVSAVSTIFVIMLTASVWIWQQSAVIKTERDKALSEKQVAEEVTDFLVATFKAADPTQTLGTQLTAGDILDQGVKQINDQAITPLVKNRLLVTLGDVYNNLSALNEAESLYDQYQFGVSDATQNNQFLLKKAGLMLRTRKFDPGLAIINGLNPADLTQAQHFEYWRLKVSLTDQTSDIHEATPLAEAFMAWTAANYGQQSEQYIQSMLSLAGIMKVDSNYLVEALEIYLQAKKLLDENSADPLLELEVMKKIVNLQIRLAQYQEAEIAAKQYLKMATSIFGRNSQKHISGLSLLSRIKRNLGDWENAIQLSEESIGIKQQLIGKNHQNMATTYYNTGLIYLEQGKDIETAVDYFQQAFDVSAGATGRSLINLNIMRLQYAKALIELNQFDEAEALLFELLDYYISFNMPAKKSETQARVYLAYLYAKKEQSALAEKYLQEATPILQKNFEAGNIYRSLADQVQKTLQHSKH